MHDWQNTTVATTVSMLLLVVLFLCPWRIESTGEIQWSPIYQPPMSYVRSYDADRGRLGGSGITSDEAHIAVGWLVLEVLAVGLAGSVVYFFAGGADNNKESRY